MVAFRLEGESGKLVNVTDVKEGLHLFRNARGTGYRVTELLVIIVIEDLLNHKLTRRVVLKATFSRHP